MNQDASIRRTASVAEYRARREEKRLLQKKAARRRHIFMVLGAVVLVLILLVVGDLAGTSGKIHRGVEVAGIALGGKTPTEARAYLDKELARREKTPVTITHEKDSWKIAAHSIGLSYNTSRMVNEAYEVGRESNIFTATGMRIASYFSPRRVMLRSSVDNKKANSVYKKIMKVTDRKAKNASVKLDGDSFVAADGRDGLMLNTELLTSKITSAIIGSNKTIAAPIETAPMTIDLTEAQTAAEVAQKTTTTKVKALHGKSSWTLEPAQLRKLISFKHSDELKDADAAFDVAESSKAVNQKANVQDVANKPVWLVPLVSSKKVADDIIPLMGEEVGYAPKDARFSVSGGNVTIIAGKNGKGADPVKLAQDLMTIMQKPVTPKQVTVVTHEVEPDLTTKKAKTLGIKERLSTYSTTFSSGDKPRVNNIRQLAEGLDGTLIAPGKEFSLNGTIGERTAAKGYQAAGAIVDGEMVDQLGGGICQVNTTLFNAALLSGVQVTQRINHSDYISHYPLGRDATVSWGGPDFKFINNTGHWLLIATSSSSSSVVVSFYGTDPDWTITLEPAKWLSHTKPKVKRVDDSTLPEGSEVTKQQGKSGGKVSFRQTVTDNSGKSIIDRTFLSNYKATDTIIRVGTKKKSKDVGKNTDAKSDDSDDSKNDSSR